MCPSGAGRGGAMGSLHRSARAAGRCRRRAPIALSTLLLIGCVAVAFAQEPPPP